MFILLKLDLCFKALVEHDAAIEDLINNCNPAWLIAFRSLQNILQVVVETESQKNTLGIEKGCQKCFSNILQNILQVWWKLKVRKRLWDWEGLPRWCCRRHINCQLGNQVEGSFLSFLGIFFFQSCCLLHRSRVQCWVCFVFSQLVFSQFNRRSVICCKFRIVHYHW